MGELPYCVVSTLQDWLIALCASPEGGQRIELAAEAQRAKLVAFLMLSFFLSSVVRSLLSQVALHGQLL